jgi:hypothetical protein
MKMKHKYVTESEIVAIIRDSVKGTSMITVELDSDMDGKGKMLKTGNPFVGQGIVKRETLNGVIGYDYGKAVNRLAGKEDKDERECKLHPWGDMDEKRLFRIHRKTGAQYLSMKVEKCEVHGFFKPDGSIIDSKKIKPFIPEKSKSSTQEDLDGEVIARDYSIKNIMMVRMLGEEYRIIHHISQDDEKVVEKETVSV